MPLNIKTLNDFVRIISGKFTQSLPSVDPTITPSLANANVVASAIAGVGLQDGIADAVDQMFWQTADDDFLAMIGGYDTVTRKAASQSSGYCCVANGVASVPSGTSFTYNGNTYSALSTASSTIFAGYIQYQITGGVCICTNYTSNAYTTLANHNLATGLQTSMSAMTNSALDGNQAITVLSETTFQFSTSEVSSSGTGHWHSTFCLVNIQSINTGLIQNISSGGVLSTTISSVAQSGYVTVDGISGGADIESIDSYRTRIGQAHNLTPGIATPPTIVYSSKKIAGITRVFVVRPEVDSGGNPITGGVFNTAGYLPLPGQTVVYPLQDDASPIYPSPSTLASIKSQIITDGIWPSICPDSYLMVLAPNIQSVDFTLSNIIPNTATMQSLIINQLTAYFSDITIPTGQTILLANITAFLYTVQDSATGQFLQSFTLSLPGSDIVIPSGYIATVGTITYS